MLFLFKISGPCILIRPFCCLRIFSEQGIRQLDDFGGIVWLHIPIIAVFLSRNVLQYGNVRIFQPTLLTLHSYSAIIFPNRNMCMNRNSINEREILSELGTRENLLPPLRIRLIQSDIMMGSRQIDALIEVSWSERTALFGVEAKARSTPKTFQASIDQILSVALSSGARPMIVIPYLKEENLRTLEERGVSGIDMCGNGVVMSDNFRVFRSGQPNLYRSSASIKNVYTRNSSMVARVFLCKAGYPTVQSVLDEVNTRNLMLKLYGCTPMRQSTVSKCLKTLEEDLAIKRSNGIELLQAGKLLDTLCINYRPPRRGRVVSCKLPGGGDLLGALSNATRIQNLPLVVTGLSSVNRYAVMQRGDVLKIYCPNIERLLDQMSVVETDRFPDLEVIETSEESLYFDSREELGVHFASPVQTYLELMTGDKRDIETAEQVRDFIMSEREGLL